MLKAACPHCGYTTRLTNTWAATGAPICPIHLTVMVMTGAAQPESHPVNGVRNVADVFGMLVDRMTEFELRDLGRYLNYFNGDHVEPELFLGSESPVDPGDTDEITELRGEIMELRKKMQQAHPDKGGSHEEFIQIRREYEHRKRVLEAMERSDRNAA